MKGDQSALITAALNTLCAGLWGFAGIRDGRTANVVIAMIWAASAVVWWVRYYKSRK